MERGLQAGTFVGAIVGLSHHWQRFASYCSDQTKSPFLFIGRMLPMRRLIFRDTDFDLRLNYDSPFLEVLLDFWLIATA